MIAETILSLKDPKAKLESVGGKGASLAKLARAGLPVPEGFHVTTAAYEQFVVANNLQAQILADLAVVDSSKPETLERASNAIQQRFARSEIPAEIASAIVQAYAALPGMNPPVAVRSSATAEDLPEASFAGQQETYLNVSGADAVLEATKKCWASLWTGRAIGYRHRQGIRDEGVALAVAVQLLFPAEAAGILFTANPLDGQSDEVVINAAWGLGEAVVSGQVTPDSLTVDKVTGRILQRQTGDKQVMTVRANGGTLKQAVAESLRRVPVLDNNSTAELTRLAVEIENLYGMPMDIEWALADGKFAILQARPITSLPHREAPAAVEWKLPDPKGQYMRASMVDILPDPVSPLFTTLGIPAARDGVQRVGSAVTHSEAVFPADYFLTINHYAYMNAHLPPRSWWWLISGLLPAMPRLLRTGSKYWREEARPQYAQAVALWEGLAFDQMPMDELWHGIRKVLEAAMEHLGAMMVSTMGASAGSEALFTGIYGKMIRKEGDPPAPTFLMGYDSVPIQAEKSLFDLAMWCRERAGLSAYLMETPSDQLVRQLGSDKPPGSIDLEDWQALRELLQEHLQRFGYLIYTLDFANPLPMDDPAPMLETCKMYLRGEGVNPHERQRVSQEKRIQAMQSILSRVKGLRRWIFLKSLGWAQPLAEVRESTLAEIGLGYPVLRKMLWELGRRFNQAGAIQQANDIYWLELDEVEKTIAALEHGQALSAYAEQVEQRKAAWQAARRLTPPPMLPPKKKYMGIKTDIYMAVSEEEQKEGTLKGVPTSAGQVTAPACVLHGPQDFDQMKPGSVLVAGTTTPAWTPLFAMASGIVTDIGGPLSHGSIVAREYGIPAVMGTGVATRRIHSGQVITVDGNAGLVILGKR